MNITGVLEVIWNNVNHPPLTPQGRGIEKGDIIKKGTNHSWFPQESLKSV